MANQDIIPLHVTSSKLDDEGIFLRRLLSLLLRVWLICSMGRYASPSRHLYRSYGWWRRNLRNKCRWNWPYLGRESLISES
ncbi:Uncharacterized protein HZ326_19935 [Fusarium oxysporum f. sp. albedinis]|nr:Uncharacterized protein HZ326_19935 [Fusarium oxysporum f. sp. albedinis]